MRISARPGRLAAARRHGLFLVSASFAFTAVLSAQQSTLSGTVLDASGRAVPRARIVLVAGDVEAASTISDETGRFVLTSSDHSNCRLEARLTGFRTATLPCATPPPIQFVLAVAPIAEAIVVTPTRTEVPASQAGAGITTFTAEDLERRRDPLVSDLIRSTPGVMVVASGGAGSLTSLFVRGGESNYNKVLLDGIPLNEPGGTFDFSNLTTTQLERVEIVRGAQSALFGSDAVASVVQLFTKRADPSDTRPHMAGSLEAGGYGTFNANASVSRNTNAGDYTVGIARFRTDNQGENSDFENTTVSANAGLRVGASATLRFITRGEFGRAGTPGQVEFGRPDLDAFSDRRQAVGGVTLDQPLTPSIRQRATYSLTYSRQISRNLLIDESYTPRFEDHVGDFVFDDFPYDLTTRLRRHHASYQADFRLPHGVGADHVLTALADWDGERATLADDLAGSETKASRDNFGVSLQHQAVWSRVFATASVRFEHNDSFGTAAAPRGSIVFVLHQADESLGETKVRVAAGLGIKEPTIPQSFSPPPYEGNPDLEPERSRTVEIGFEQRLADDRVRLEATWFANRFENIISTRTLSFNPFHTQYFNVGLTRARGAELGIDVAAAGGFRARAGYTFLDSEVLESTSPFNVVFEEGTSLFRRPRHSGFVGLSYAHGPLVADLTGTLIGHYVDSDFSGLTPPIVENDGRKTWDLRLSYALTPRWSAIGSIDNLTDDDYMEPLGYKTLGLVGRAGIRAAF